MMVLQLGLVTMHPSHLRFFFWTSMSARCSGLTLRYKEGNVLLHAVGAGVRRHDEARLREVLLDGDGLLGGQCREHYVGVDLFRLSRDHGDVPDVLREVGIQPPLGNFTVLLPALRSEAASAVISNHGWSASNWTNRCPTAPVAPNIPALIM